MQIRQARDFDRRTFRTNNPEERRGQQTRVTEDRWSDDPPSHEGFRRQGTAHRTHVYISGPDEFSRHLAVDSRPPDDIAVLSEVQHAAYGQKTDSSRCRGLFRRERCGYRGTEHVAEVVHWSANRQKAPEGPANDGALWVPMEELYSADVCH
ncbi:hypothetical protein FBY39_0150 [Microbacterium sp. SLBN-146]|nr:hypothetical protein FBY39_0150 [Microbacterium sp. SLBN-146]